MKRVEVHIANRLGLHARAAARFVHVANRFSCRISVSRDHQCADGKSILGLLTLAAPCGSLLQLAADGEDEDRALEELAALVRQQFDEAP